MLCVMVSIIGSRLTGTLAQHWSLCMCAVLSVWLLWLLISNVSRLTLTTFACFATVCAYGIFFGVMAMETSLLLLCGGLFFARLHRNAWVVDGASGLLLGLCFLSRIDSLLYFFPLVSALWWRSNSTRKLSFSASLGSVIGAYCVLNIVYFGTPLPISGSAKAVSQVTGVHFVTWKYFFLIGRQNQLMLLTSMLLTVLRYWQASPAQRRLVLMSLLGVPLYCTVISIHSDWMIWEWYLFPTALHVIFLTLLDAQHPAASSNRLGYATMLCALASLAFVGVRNARLAMHENAMVEAGLRLRDLLAAEPDAVIAMGDRAGAVGELLPNRLIQLEGLVMDKAYLTYLRQSTSLTDIFRRYGVDYYVATAARSDGAGCFVTSEPEKAGADSFHLSSRLCAPVVASFTLDGYNTLLFDVRPLTRARD
jgi:hypothetical protein